VRFPELLDTLVRLGHPAHESIFEISNKVFEDLLESFVYNCRHHHIIAIDKLLWFCCCKSFQNYFGGSIGKPI
jgi:hypothetical protein